MPNYEITMDVEDSGSGTIVDPTQLNDAGNAKRAEAWAVGQRNGVDVPSTDPTYHNNSKYYAQQAGSSAGSASSSADAAAAAAQHYPYVDSTSGNWMVWNTSTGAFVDTGVHAQGPTGPTGPGVPSGGTAGQVLKKVNGTDYNAEWTNNDGTTIPMSSSDATTLNAAITSQNEAIGTANIKKTTILSQRNVTSDTYILGLDDGCYQVAISTSGTTTYFPANYGTLIVNATGNAYGGYYFITSNASGGTMHYRIRQDATTWYAGWKQLALQESIDAYNLGEGTLSTIESALTTLGASMANNAVRNIRFGITANAAPLNSTTYFGTITRNSSGRYIVHAQGIGAPYMVIEGNYMSSAWTWDTMNIRGLIGFINNSSKTITFTAGVSFLLICEGSATSCQGIYMVRGGTAGTTVLTVVAGSALTVSVNANGDAITVTSNQSGQVYLYALLYSGQKAWTVT